MTQREPSDEALRRALQDLRADQGDALRRAIQDLRDADRRDAPSFGSLRSRRSAHRTISIRPVAFAAVAAALVVILGATAYRALRRDRLVVPREVVALTLWKPSTDVLLRTSTAELLKAPRLGASLIVVRTGDLP